MNAREKFYKTLNFTMNIDELPAIEWAPWWDKTITRWMNEGVPKNLNLDDSQQYFGLDPIYCIYATGCSDKCPGPSYHGGPIISDIKSYDEIHQYLFTDDIIENLKKRAKELKEMHDRGEIIIRLWLDGFFWFPRVMFGIEPHMFAFFDQPDLMHRMNNDLANFNIRVIEELFQVLKPDMVGFAEDMSYNHGSMLSYELFREFITPYYQRVIPIIKKHDVKVMIDSDGDITSMIPWMQEAGIEGVYPLERQAGVDIMNIRNKYPDFLMLGGFNKLVMCHGEEAMKDEFERILPVMKSGGYIPSVDHQTPPDVSLQNYKIYVRLLKEYCKKAVL